MLLEKYITPWLRTFEAVYLSLFSLDFYKKVFSSFKGTGLKHLLACYGFAAIISSVMLSLNYDQLRRYFQNNEKNSYSTYFDNIFSQIPELSYDGKNLTIQSEQEKDKQSSKQDVLLKIELQRLDRSAQVIVTKSKVIITNSSFPIELPYSSISKSPGITNGADIKRFIGASMPTLLQFFFLSWIVTFFVNYSSTLLIYSSLIILAGLLSKFALGKSMRDGARTILFAIAGPCTISIMLEPILWSAGMRYYSFVTIALAATALASSKTSR